MTTPKPECPCGFTREELLALKFVNDQRCIALYLNENDEEQTCGQLLTTHPREGRLATANQIDQNVFVGVQKPQYSAIFHLEKKKSGLLHFCDYDSMVIELHNYWKELKFKLHFVVKHKGFGNEVRDDETLTQLLNVLNQHTNLDLWVDTKCKGFSHYARDKNETFAVLSIQDVLRRDSDFPADATVSDELYSAETEKVYDELLRRYESIDIGQPSKSTRREFISPVLIGAIRLANYLQDDLQDDPKVQMVVEKIISGNSGNGPMDYAISYKHVYIVVGEANRNNIDAGIRQNLLQQWSVLETIANVRIEEKATGTMRKRKFLNAFTEIQAIGTFGIVTTGTEWVFTRGVKAHSSSSSPTFAYRSEIYHLHSPLPKFEVTALNSLKAQIQAVLRRIVFIIKKQKTTVEQYKSIITEEVVQKLNTFDPNGSSDTKDENENEEDDENENQNENEEVV